ncbi:uncharacterized protein K452DRAFT_345450 [Aplosporella prunicola CBS 121167]|uniref:Uncharacterized protein n=1 Tax=Aplosporella prunicola CBS 121167 TaxID=1176127 RepID=A0A6A6BNA0_9PEZI|nr:uncharacterized protein K452DRAFT_345450 [Aplosporella prunicola CBS 121167]KAF2144021.1 hypothetical protein K452DRAFT_345450 [Aplosporella prunicola CBS 121167]
MRLMGGLASWMSVKDAVASEVVRALMAAKRRATIELLSDWQSAFTSHSIINEALRRGNRCVFGGLSNSGYALGCGGVAGRGEGRLGNAAQWTEALEGAARDGAMGGSLKASDMQHRKQSTSLAVVNLGEPKGAATPPQPRSPRGATATNPVTRKDPATTYHTERHYPPRQPSYGYKPSQDAHVVLIKAVFDSYHPSFGLNYLELSAHNASPPAAAAATSTKPSNREVDKLSRQLHGGYGIVECAVTGRGSSLFLQSTNRSPNGLTVERLVRYSHYLRNGPRFQHSADFRTGDKGVSCVWTWDEMDAACPPTDCDARDFDTAAWGANCASKTTCF